MTVSYGLVVRLSRVAGLIGFLLVFTPLVWIAGPTLEARVAPVLRSEVTGPADLVGQRACWPIRQTKLRDGSPDYASYFVFFSDGVGRVSVTPFLETTGDLVATPGFARHPRGDSWTNRYCVDIPPRIARVPNKAVEGLIFYRVWHGLWLVPAAQPKVVI